MSRKIELTVDKLVGETVTQLGYELVDVEFAEEGENGWVLTIYIFHQNGVTLNDCEKVSRAVDPILDEADPIDLPYILSVSSPGIDRPLKKPRDFERSLGKEVEVHLYAPINKKKLHVGKLIEADDECIVIDVQGSACSFERKVVSLVRPTVHFH